MSLERIKDPSTLHEEQAFFQPLQLLSTSNIKHILKSIKIFLDGPSTNKAIRSLLFSIQVSIFQMIIIESNTNSEGYFKPPRSLSCNSLYLGQQDSSIRNSLSTINKSRHILHGGLRFKYWCTAYPAIKAND